MADLAKEQYEDEQGSGGSDAEFFSDDAISGEEEEETDCSGESEKGEEGESETETDEDAAKDVSARLDPGLFLLLLGAGFVAFAVPVPRRGVRAPWELSVGSR